MIIFQTAGYGYAGTFSFKPGLLVDLQAPATTFRSSDYIHRLNRVLQAEVRALSGYLALSGYRDGDQVVADGTTGHQFASRELVRLIVANRGVPEDRSALSLGLTRRLVVLVARMPAGIAARATTATLRQLERQVVPGYQHLLTVAPPRDQATLTELLEQTQRQEQALSTFLV